MKQLFNSWIIILSAFLAYLGVSMLAQFHELEMKVIPFFCLVWAGLQIASLKRNVVVLVLCLLANLTVAWLIFEATAISFKEFRYGNGLGLNIYALLHVFTGVWPLYQSLRQPPKPQA